MKKILVVMRETFPTNDIFTEKNLKEKRILNPYDEYALFQGKKVIGKVGGEVTCIFLSERKSKYGLRTALGLGADNGIFIYCPNRSEKELGIILAKEIKKENYDSIFIGIRDVNDDREELPYILGTELGIPVYSHLLLIDNKNNIIIAKREKEETIDTIKIHKKGIFAFSQNVYEPQYPTIESIMTINQKI